MDNPESQSYKYRYTQISPSDPCRNLIICIFFLILSFREQQQKREEYVCVYELYKPSYISLLDEVV
jgi:hypothetical protein